MHHRTKEIQDLAKLIGRSSNSVAMRLSNFAHIDPYHQKRGIKGLSGGRNQVEPIWNEFINNREELLFESERILALYQKSSIESKYKDILTGIENFTGETKIREVKTRVNQDVFRQIVIANYAGRCAISNINISELLIASHIVPWSHDHKQRLNPQNGICLSPLYDKCFDKGLISIDPNYKICFSNKLKEAASNRFYQDFFEPYEGKSINLPLKFVPKREFLEYHFNEIFQK